MKHVWKPTRSLLAVLTACASLSALTASGQTVPPPAPYGALPSQGQLQWHEMEMYNMIEFNQINYLDKDWGWGDESPEIVNPVNFNAEEIVLRAKKAGSKGFLINAKHHGGFCMWPSRTTDYNISRSPWRNGKGDWVGEWEAACRKHGLKFGVYLSPWDRNTAKFGTPEYLDMFKAQLRELLTQYGDLFIIWFDGAPGEGGDGYYGGANEYRGGFLDYYDWENIYALCRELQPNAVIFGDPGPTCAGWAMRKDMPARPAGLPCLLPVRNGTDGRSLPVRPNTSNASTKETATASTGFLPKLTSPCAGASPGTLPTA